jgi:hypothetical protein
MNQIPKMAAFVQHNMPQNQPDSLTPQKHTTSRDIHPQQAAHSV